MINIQKLKKLAEAAKSDCGDYVALNDYGMAVPPSVVLELIANNERIEARLCVCRDCAGQGEVYSGHDSYQGHFQPPEPDMNVCGTCGGDGVLGAIEDFEALAAKRDELLTDLTEAAATLRRYEALHRAKGTDDSTVKAEVNAALASRFEATIAKATQPLNPA